MLLAFLLFLSIVSFAQSEGNYGEKATLKKLTNYCSPFDTPIDYSKSVRIKAILWRSSDIEVDGEPFLFFSEDCNNPDYFSVADFSKFRSKKMLSRLKSLRKSSKSIYQDLRKRKKSDNFRQCSLPINNLLLDWLIVSIWSAAKSIIR